MRYGQALKATSVALFLISLSSYAGPRESVEAAYRTFLVNLGFEDFSGQIRANVAKHTGLAEISEQVSGFQEHRYEVYNHAREVAVQAAVYLNRNPLLLDQFISYAAELAALQPVDPPSSYPQEIIHAPEDQRARVQGEYILRWAEHQIRQDIAKYLSDYVSMISDEKSIAALNEAWRQGTPLTTAQNELIADVRSATAHIANLVSFVYLDAEMGKSRYGGTALAAALLKYAQDHGMREQVTGKLEAALQKQGMHLADIIGDQLILPGQNGEELVPIRNGDIVMERSVGPEAGRLTWAVKPSWQNFPFAFVQKLVGHLTGMILPRSESDDSTSGPWWKQLKESLGEATSLRRGFSHVGMAEVKTSENITWVRFADLYPAANSFGGVRYVDINQFAPNGPFMRFGVVRYDAVKFLREAKRQAREGLYQPEVWIGDAAAQDATGKAIADPSKPRRGYRVEVTEEEFNRVLDVPESQAEEWLAGVLKKATDRFHRFLTEDFFGFNEQFGNLYGLGFCSETVWLSVATTSGFDLQRHPDHWRLELKLLNAFGSDLTSGINLDSRIVSPMGFFWQSSLIGDFKVVDYPYLDPKARDKAVSRPPDFEKNSGMTRQLEAFVIHEGLNDKKTGAERDEQIYTGWLVDELQSAIATAFSGSGRGTKALQAGIKGGMNSVERLRRQLTRQTDESDCKAVLHGHYFSDSASGSKSSGKSNR